MSSNPNHRPTETAYRPPTTQQPAIPERDRLSDPDSPDGNPSSAPSIFAPTERASLPDMFETEAEYHER
ncbi:MULTISPECIES: hypothetical protein [unclassified Halorhabdus]|uniref:hypothetical protein n=1 Tax=unclassified Halorhabdus TaxID=2621901 RepID=UPI0012B3783B|nr:MULTISPECIES: hypothetical protein [unclassified Halorhabdus]